MMEERNSFFAPALLFLLIFSCFGCSLDDSFKDLQKDSGSLLELSFHYQLQGASFESLRSVPQSILIIDPDDSRLSVEEIKTLSESKTLYAYLSIGEAENYRRYWGLDWREGYPSFIGEENPEWRGNFKVEYWDSRWQEVVLSRSEMIAKQGYGGIYLDTVDSYQYFLEKGNRNAPSEMAHLVNRISARAKSVNPDILIIGQNGALLLDNPLFYSALDGVGAESTWLLENRTQDPEHTSLVLSYLRKVRDDGKIVFAIDYPLEARALCDFYSGCSSEGFLCSSSSRLLDLKSPLYCTRT